MSIGDVWSPAVMCPALLARHNDRLAANGDANVFQPLADLLATDVVVGRGSPMGAHAARVRPPRSALSVRPDRRQARRLSPARVKACMVERSSPRGVRRSRFSMQAD